jgi:hypothetical protein
MKKGKSFQFGISGAESTALDFNKAAFKKRCSWICSF